MSWRTSISASLARLPAARLPAAHPWRMAVVGIGHELKGDDAVGPAVAALLKPAVAHLPTVLVENGGSAPENVVGKLCRFAPHLVVMVDAADLGAAPGTVQDIDWRIPGGSNGSTHSLSLRMVADMLVQETGCEIALIGIQPAHLAFCEPLSPPVQAAAEALAAALATMLIETAAPA